MRSKSIVLLALALGCGLVASIGISQVMERRNASDANAGETEAILVALTDISPTDLYTAQNIKVEEWPKGKVPQGAITKLEDLEGKRCKLKVFAGEPILASRVAQPGDQLGATTQIPKGYRVVAVRVDAVSGGGSLILPGDRVDLLVYLSKNPTLGVNETCTKTVLEDIKIFAVDTIFDRNTEHDEAAIQAKTVSLLVTPAQAEKVMLATEMGSVRLVLRSGDDPGKFATNGTKSSDITGSDGGDRQAETTKPQASLAQASSTASNVAGAAKSLLELLKQQKNGAKVKQEEAPWKMTLLNGAEVSSAEFNGSDGTPITPVAAQPAAAAPQSAQESPSSSDEDQNNQPVNPNESPSDPLSSDSAPAKRSQFGAGGTGVTLTK